MRTRTLEPSLSVLIKHADTAFSDYIRLKASENGMVKCFICGTKVPWRQADCAHWIRREIMPTRYSEINTAATCQYCNRLDPDHEDKFEAKLRERHGDLIVDSLIKTSYGLAKYTRPEVEYLIEYFTAKFVELTTKKR
jgi:hypothetical protein